MKKTFLSIGIAVCGLAMVGCQVPTTTTFKLNPLTGSVSWSNPKDTTLSQLSAGVATNGTHYITIGTLSTVNNPAVIGAVGTAQANSITATGTAATQIANAITGALGTAGGSAAAAALK